MEKESKKTNRKNEILSAAIEVFAEIGYYRATTAKVAERASISQPYIFKFFSSKEELLLNALQLSWERIIKSFRKTVEITSADKLEWELIEAYEEILRSYKSEILLQMQSQTIPDDSIRTEMQRGFREVNSLVVNAFKEANIENSEERAFLFLARGMLCNVSMALDMPELLHKKRG